MVKGVYYSEKRKRKTIIALKVTRLRSLVRLVNIGCKKNRLLRGSELLEKP